MLKNASSVHISHLWCYFTEKTVWKGLQFHPDVLHVGLLVGALSLWYNHPCRIQNDVNIQAPSDCQHTQLLVCKKCITVCNPHNSVALWNPPLLMLLIYSHMCQEALERSCLHGHQSGLKTLPSGSSFLKSDISVTFEATKLWNSLSLFIQLIDNIPRSLIGTTPEHV